MLKNLHQRSKRELPKNQMSDMVICVQGNICCIVEKSHRFFYYMDFLFPVTFIPRVKCRDLCVTINGKELDETQIDTYK
jgi:hypothetical protein